ncbi:Nramp family divalent metal transporter [Haladaptatus caseinilyticus]|uniref:Nramp family divalent metal transporter n=1 Tax=Haladaptatus caseinilyticus TaxID=2993314 RepID=UPI00224B094A|nr:Nramp family divalent metal transporter [Haladaptatus caseinilyticus]
MNIIDRLQSIGPGAMVAAAFIGPGTVTTASVTGAKFGYALVWTIVFSIIATIVLQEMSARLGVVSRRGLGEALKEQFDNPALSTISIALVVSAIGIGTAAYETGNILGGAAGLEGVTGISANIWGPLMGLCAGALLWTGRYKLIEKALVFLVGLMAVSFVIDAIIIGPDLGSLAMGFVPSVPEGSTFLITGLIGTTVVGYNLFLHAGSVQERWAGPDELGESRADTILSILIGGAITIAILVTAAAAFPVGTQISDVSQMAEQIEPLAGPQATFLFGIGLFAAGFTSATTAPLAGAYATAGALGWDTDLKSTKFRAVWGSILLIGIVFSGLGYSPVQAIVFAQVANGILLPIVALFLIYVMNDRDILGKYVNSTAQNVVGVVVTLIVVWLGLRSLYGVAQSLGVL